MVLTQSSYVDKTSVVKSIWNLPILRGPGLRQPLELIRMQTTLWPQPNPPGSESAPADLQFLKHWLNPQTGSQVCWGQNPRAKRWTEGCPCHFILFYFITSN